MCLPAYNKPTRDVGKTRERLVNHWPEASDFQAFLMFAQHPKWFYYAGKLTEICALLLL